MKLFHRFILFFVLLQTTIVNAQPYFQWNDSIEVKIGGNYMANPWAGGLNFVQVSEIDLNMDGIKDLFVFDRTGNKVRTFINKGTANTVDYKYAPQYESKFPRLQDWALLKDYNCDGKEDIFCHVTGGFAVYKNISDSFNGLQFALVVPLQYAQYYPNQPLINLYVSSVDLPAIADIDNDGDLDIITFGITGTYMEYHQNQSMELYGTCDSLTFKVKNFCWGYAAENAYTNIFSLHDTCFNNIPNPGIAVNNTDGEQREPVRHSGSCQLCLDLDGDTDQDLVVGGISYNNLTSVINGGTPLSSSMIAVDPTFPSNDTNTSAVDITSFPCGYYVDVNSDGAKDLIVSPQSPNASEDFSSVIYYKNIGTTSFPVFQFQQSNLLQDNMIEVGEGAYPVFFDYDNDGLKDLFIGNFGYFATTGFSHQIAQFKNIGTSTLPEFELITRDYAQLSSFGITNMVPAFGDLDADGDADMMIGGFDGKLQYFENDALPGATANFVLSQSNFKNSNNRVIDIGDFAAPQITDVDNDGKNDLVVGGRNGKIAYYHHIGSGTTTVPLMDSITHFFGKIKVNLPGYVTGYSHPFLFKQNNITKLLVGEESGYLRLYDNMDGNLTGGFSLVDSTYENIFQGTRTTPSGADIDNDGYMDMIIGNYQGGVSYYKGVSSPLSVINNGNSILWDFNVFPNPANTTLIIKITNDNLINPPGSFSETDGAQKYFNNSYTLELYTILGQLLISQKIINNNVVLSTQNLSAGIYICKVSERNADGKIKNEGLVKRIIIQH